MTCRILVGLRQLKKSFLKIVFKLSSLVVIVLSRFIYRNQGLIGLYFSVNILLLEFNTLRNS